MSDLVVLAYADEHRASEVMATLQRLLATGSADGVDAVCIVRRNDWTVTLNREEELVAPDDGSVGYWRSLISSLILIPGGARLRSKVAAFGIEPGFERRVTAALPPGSSAVLMIATPQTLPSITPALQCFGGTMLTTPIERHVGSLRPVTREGIGDFASTTHTAETGQAGTA